MWWVLERKIVINRSNNKLKPQVRHSLNYSFSFLSLYLSLSHSLCLSLFLLPVVVRGVVNEREQRNVQYSEGEKQTVNWNPACNDNIHIRQPKMTAH